MAAKKDRQLRIICLLACFLFAFAVSADPLLHSHDHDEGYQVECQFCKNDVPGTLSSSLADRVAYLYSPQPSEISEKFLSTTTSNYSPRAPPTI